MAHRLPLNTSSLLAAVVVLVELQVMLILEHFLIFGLAVAVLVVLERQLDLL